MQWVLQSACAASIALLPGRGRLDGGQAPMTVHGRPRFARRSFRDDIEEQIAPVHPDFACGLVPLSLMGLAGRLPIALAHSRCYGRFGFGQPRSDLFAIIA